MIDSKNVVKDDIKIIWDHKSKQSLFFSYSSVKQIYEKEKIKVEGLGTPITSRKQNKLLINPFFLNKYETFYLIEKGKNLIILV